MCKICERYTRYCIQLFQLRLSPEQSGKVEYERERLLGIANKLIEIAVYYITTPYSICTLVHKVAKGWVGDGRCFFIFYINTRQSTLF